MNQLDLGGIEPVACYGMTCPHRADCELHAMLGLLDGHVIATCPEGRQLDQSDALPLGPAKPRPAPAEKLSGPGATPASGLASKAPRSNGIEPPPASSPTLRVCFPRRRSS